MGSAYYWRKLRESKLNEFDEFVVRDINFLERHYNVTPRWIHVSPNLYDFMNAIYTDSVYHSDGGVPSTYRGLYIVTRLDYKGYQYDISTDIDKPRFISEKLD